MAHLTGACGKIVMPTLLNLSGTLAGGQAPGVPVTNDLKAAQAKADEVDNLCLEARDRRDGRDNITRRLAVTGILFGGLGTVGSSVAAVTDDKGTKTGIAIGTAITGGIVTTVSTVALVYKNDSNTLESYFQAKQELEDAAADA